MQTVDIQIVWYLIRNQQQWGPISDAEMRHFVRLGHLLPTDFVWNSGMADWVMACAVPGLLPAAMPPPPPAVTSHASTVAPIGGDVSNQRLAVALDTQGRNLARAEHPDAVATPTTTALIAYILLLVTFTSLIGLILAIVNLGTKPDWLATHYRWQVRTFLISLVYVFVGALTLPILIGGVILLTTVIWVIVRYVKGISALNRREPIANVETWGW